jgi:hypothetical protein
MIPLLLMRKKIRGLFYFEVKTTYQTVETAVHDAHSQRLMLLLNVVEWVSLHCHERIVYF